MPSSVRPGGRQRGVGAILGMVILDVCFCPEAAKTRWFGFGNQTIWFGGSRELVLASILPLSSLPEPCSALLPPPLYFSPHQASLCYSPKIRSLALPFSECLPVDQQKTHWVSPALVGDQVQLLLPEKPNGPVWHSGHSGFPTPRPFCHAGGRRVRNSHLLHSILHGQIPE
jgi:hypothetical protein